MIKTGSDVAIWIKLTNDSTSTVDLSASWSDLTGVDPNYEYDIRDSRGNAVPHRIHSHPELGTGRAIFGDLPSGQSTEFSEDISRLVDISDPGTYTIQLRRSFRDFPTYGVNTAIRSNQITVTVEDPKRAGTPLDESVPDFTLQDATLIDGISLLSLKVTAHIGLEEITRQKIMDPPDRRILFSLRLENRSVRDILDALCQSDSRYMWSVDGETINVYPRMTTEDPSYLFNLRLDTLQLDAVADPDHALTPLVRKLPAQQIGYMGVGLSDNAYPAPWTTRFENLTVRQFANRISEHMGAHTSWVWQGGHNERMFTFVTGGFQK